MHYDVVLDTQQLFKSASILPFLNIKRKVTLTGGREFYQLFSNEIYKESHKLFDPEYHVVKRNLEFAQHIGADTSEVKMVLKDATNEIKEKIKADLESKSPYTNGESYSISIQEKNSGTYTLLNSDGFPITKKEFAIEEAEAHGMYGITTEIAKTCRLIPPDDQIYNHIKLKLGIDGEKSSNTFNIFIGRPYNFWIYEDLTEYYKDKYPDGKVKEIVRLLKSKPNNPTKQ